MVPSVSWLSIRHPLLITHPDQIIGRKLQNKLEVQLLVADEPAFVQTRNCLGPVQAFFNPLADYLADLAPKMADGAPICRR